jgi:hypothetical protein
MERQRPPPWLDRIIRRDGKGRKDGRDRINRRDRMEKGMVA